MVQLKFQHIKLLAVYTNDIFDQNNFVNLTRISLCNLKKLLKDLFFASQNTLFSEKQILQYEYTHQPSLNTLWKTFRHNSKTFYILALKSVQYIYSPWSSLKMNSYMYLLHAICILTVLVVYITCK